ncbi:hypothetical protein SAMN05444050_4391 [Afipia sp. GAS231]|nr:hypothetical protein SAMN05444050_4391 [Afipia sp. GAS231]
MPTAAELAADLAFLESQYSNVPIHPKSEAERKFEHELEFEHMALELGTRLDRDHAATALKRDCSRNDVGVVGPCGFKEIPWTDGCPRDSRGQGYGSHGKQTLERFCVS